MGMNECYVLWAIKPEDEAEVQLPIPSGIGFQLSRVDHSA
jgi:hypothetical protein